METTVETTICEQIVKSTGMPCCRPVIRFSQHCGYHSTIKKTRRRRTCTPRMLEECSICYTNMLHTQPRQACGHRFHDRCIVKWFKTGHNTCPLCRTVLHEELSDQEDETDATYAPPIYVLDSLHGSIPENPIIIEDEDEDEEEDASNHRYTPTTSNNYQQMYIASSPQFSLP